MKYQEYYYYTTILYLYLSTYIHTYTYMKMNKTLSLDVELVEKLGKQANASSLVNEVMTSYLDQKALEFLGVDRLKLLLVQSKIRDQALTKMKEIKENGRKQ